MLILYFAQSMNVKKVRMKIRWNVLVFQHHSHAICTCMADVLMGLYKIIEYASHTEDKFLEATVFFSSPFVHSSSRVPQVEFRKPLCQRSECLHPL